MDAFARARVCVWAPYVCLYQTKDEPQWKYHCECWEKTNCSNDNSPNIGYNTDTKKSQSARIKWNKNFVSRHKTWNKSGKLYALTTVNAHENQFSCIPFRRYANSLTHSLQHSKFSGRWNKQLEWNHIAFYTWLLNPCADVSVLCPLDVALGFCTSSQAVHRDNFSSRIMVLLYFLDIVQHKCFLLYYFAHFCGRRLFGCVIRIMLVSKPNSLLVRLSARVLVCVCVFAVCSFVGKLYL